MYKLIFVAVLLAFIIMMFHLIKTWLIAPEYNKDEEDVDNYTEYYTTTNEAENTPNVPDTQDVRNDA